MKFDAKNIKLMKPGKSEGIDEFPGLRIVASASKRIWTYRYRSPKDNSIRQIKLGEWPSMTKGQAIAAWEAARTARENGVDAAAEKKAKRKPAAAVVAPTAYTVRKLCTEYLESLEGARSRAVAALFRRLLDPIAALEPHAVTRKMAYDLISSVSDRPALAVKLRSELSLAWAKGIDSDRVDPNTVNWWRDVMKRDSKLRATPRDRVLTEDELRSILPWLPLQPDPLRSILTLYLWTGARGGELVQMRGDQIAVENGVSWWTLPKSKTKSRNRSNATDLRVPLIGRAGDIVSALKLEHNNGYLFPGDKGGHVTQSAVGEALARRMPDHPQKVNSGLTVSGWTAHDCRRTVRTMLAQLGAPHDVGEAILGHAIPGVAGVYQRYKFDKEKVTWLTALSDELERLAAL